MLCIYPYFCIWIRLGIEENILAFNLQNYLWVSEWVILHSSLFSYIGFNPTYTLWKKICTSDWPFLSFSPVNFSEDYCGSLDNFLIVIYVHQKEFSMDSFRKAVNSSCSLIKANSYCKYDLEWLPFLKCITSAFQYSLDSSLTIFYFHFPSLCLTNTGIII